MNKNKAKIMDEALAGPRLFCVCCDEKKVFSPCYCCQSSNERKDRLYCRGCGLLWKGSASFGSCSKKYEICKETVKEEILLVINKIITEKETSLYLDYSYLEELPAALWELNLECLSLDSNRLRELPASVG